MTETTQEERRAWRVGCAPNLIKRLHKDDAIFFVGRLVQDADRLAQLEDGIRALADKWEKDANSLRDGKTVQAHAEADTLQDCAGFARALLDGE